MLIFNWYPVENVNSVRRVAVVATKTVSVAKRFNIKDNSMNKYIVLVFCSIFVPLVVQAQSVTESWLRQAGISCGGGLGLEVQGELDASVFRKLKFIDAQGEGTYQQSDTEKLLRQFAEEEKSQTYVNYVNCLLNVMGVATAASSLPTREVVLDSPIAVAPLETIRRGQRFTMMPGETIAVYDLSIIFTLDGTEEYRGQNIMYFSWSNSETGEGQSKSYVAQSQLVKIREKCTLTPYQIDLETKMVSFISNC